MIKSNFLLLSQGLNWDNITGLASVFNIFERIDFEKFPSLMPSFYLIAMIERDDLNKDSEVELEVKLFNNKEEIKTKAQKQPIKFKEGLFRHKRMIAFNGVEIKEIGNLTARLYCNGKEINGYSINIGQHIGE